MTIEPTDGTVTRIATNAIDRIRRPEYTGRNRCVPCTAVNLVLAVAAAGGIAVGAGAVLGPPAGALLGGGSLAVALAAIYLRGYLVPGTPWLTRTYFPDRVLRWFDKTPAPPGDGDGGIDVAAVLARAGAVTECERGDDLCLTGEFRAAWRDRIDALRDGDAVREDLAAVLGVERDRLSFEEHADGGAFVAYLDDRRAGQWESRAAFLADVAAARELDARYGTWSGIDGRGRSAVLAGLRVFLDRCPTCEGPVSIDREVVESCCRSVDVVAVTCRDCGARLFETEHPG